MSLALKRNPFGARVLASATFSGDYASRAAYTTVEQVETFPNARTAILLYLIVGGGERLTNALLRHAQQAAIAGRQSIDALDGKHTDVVESDNLGLGRRAWLSRKAALCTG